MADGETKILWHMDSMFEPLRQDYHPFQKVVLMFGADCNTALTLAILQMFDIWTQAINICVPLMGVNLLCQTYTQWNTSRKTAYFSLGCAVFVFACVMAVFFIK